MPKTVAHDLSTQAGRVIAKFGTATHLSRALAQVGHPRSVATICKWTYPKSRYNHSQCTGGLIPTRMIPPILEAARLWGIIFTDRELRP